MAKRKINYPQKCEDTWKLIVKAGGSCIVTHCQKRHGSHAHHLLEKGFGCYPHFAYIPFNGVEICFWHHTLADDISAHGNIETEENFDNILQQERNTQWDWKQRNEGNKKHAGQKIDYETTYHYLLNILNDLESGIPLHELEGGKYFLIINNEFKEFIS